MSEPKRTTNAGITRRELGLPASWRTTRSARYFLQNQMERLAAKEISANELTAMTVATQAWLDLFMSEHEQKNREGADGEPVGKLIDQPGEDVEPEDQTAFDFEGDFVEVETEQERELRKAAERRQGDRYHTENGTIVALNPRG